MTYFRTLAQRAVCFARRYKNNTQGSMSIEAVLTLPLLLLGLLFSYTYFAAFQVKSTANKAAYTVSDYMSRQTDSIDSDFIEGLASIYGFLTNTGTYTLRVSSVTWSETDGDGAYELEWSYAADSGDALTDETLSDIEDSIPSLTSGETVLIVETTTDWAPIFEVGLDSVTFSDFVATKPRYATQVTFDDS